MPLIIVAKDTFEFIVGDLASLVKIMYADHFIEFFLSNAAAHTFESFFEVGYSNEISVIYIKLFEQTPQLFIIEVFVDRKCGRNELLIVDHSVAIVINLTDDLRNFFVIIL